MVLMIVVKTRENNASGLILTRPTKTRVLKTMGTAKVIPNAFGRSWLRCSRWAVPSSTAAAVKSLTLKMLSALVTKLTSRPILIRLGFRHC